jgi:nucleoside-diphosphate-sugar epimerase
LHHGYALAKKAAETLCLAYYQQYKIPVKIARAAQIMGPGLALDDGRLHIDFIAQLMEKNEITLKSDGSARRSFLYITDAIAGLLLIMLRGVPGQAYNVADENSEARVLQLAELACSLLPERHALLKFDLGQRDRPEVKLAVKNVTLDSSKLRALGWKPSMNLPAGFYRMMLGYGLTNNPESLADAD